MDVSRKRPFDRRIVWRSGRWIAFAVATYLLSMHVWWGFHHDYGLGVFAWLWLGGEEGNSVTLNPCGLILTVAAWCLLLVLVRKLEFHAAAAASD